jgi:hypothetical protein
VCRRLAGADRFQFRSQDENNMLLLLFGPRYNKKAIAAGAQTERRGGAGPVSALLGGENSPADFLFSTRRFVFLIQMRA